MSPKEIAALDRWERARCVKDFSTKQSSDRNTDNERFARDKKVTLSDRKEEYAKKIEVIWKRQLLALSDKTINGTSMATPEKAQKKAPPNAKTNAPEEESDSDFENDLVAEMAELHETRQLQAKVGDTTSSNDARDYLQACREREQENQARGTLQSLSFGPFPVRSDRKVIRKRTTKTHPDGRRTIHFQYILQSDEVNSTIERLHNKDSPPCASARCVPSLGNGDYEGRPPPGHAMFEEDDAQNGGLGRGKKRTGQGVRFGQYNAAKATFAKKKKQKK